MRLFTMSLGVLLISTGSSYAEWIEFNSGCLAEDFILNTECGTIGVFASSNASATPSYNYYGQGILDAIYEKGITRVGDAIMYSRLQGLDYFIEGGDPCPALAQFNLLGDPAVDVGDRIKFRDHCDLIICPDDIAMNAYPTMSVDGNSRIVLTAYVRNAGFASTGQFNVTMEVSDVTGSSEVLTSQCSGLSSGEETMIEFVWNNTWFTPPGTLILEASAADPGGQAPDSWMPNNSAEIELEIADFYPNESGWPVDVGESVRVPPVLCDFDGNASNGLEIVLATEYNLLVFDEESPPCPVWESSHRQLFHTGNDEMRPSIPVAGNITGDDPPEVVVDTKHNLYVYNNTSADPVLTLNHPEGWFREIHSVSLGDFVAEPDFTTRDEIVLIRDNELKVLDVVGSALVPVRTVTLPGVPSDALFVISWSALQDINSDGIFEIVVRARWKTITESYATNYCVYDYEANDFISQRQWTEKWSTIPAVGGLPSGDRIAIPTDQATSTQNPVWLLNPMNLTLGTPCLSNPSLDSDNVPYCVMADWDPIVAGVDRVIANTENQCFAWRQNGRHSDGFPKVYSSQGSLQPPFPALGELDDQDIHQHADVLAATAEGSVTGLSSNGILVDNLGFPYTLPSSMLGGFVVADIDRDGKVEVVFGTMDNYLHVWELGSCTSGYTP